MYKTIVILLASFLLAGKVTLLPLTAYADPGPLDLARDFVDSTDPSLGNIGHSFYFVLPTDAKQITPGDYVQLDMSQYADFTINLSLSGAFGTPTYTNTNGVISITNIAVLSGTGLGIDGIRARNPNSLSKEVITISICDDAGCTSIRNQAMVEPSESGNVVGVSATVETTLSALSITGYTSANAFVTLVEDPSVLGTTVADGTGFFSFSLTALNPGPHTYKLTGTDPAGLNTSSTVLNLFLLGGNLTTVTNLLLSPTITENKTSINPGDTITMSGTTRPGNQVNLFIEAPLRSYTANSDPSTGAWSVTVPSTDTSGFTPGQYQTYALSQDTLGDQSPVSISLNFTVNSPTTNGNNPPPNCDISHGDLNCDGKTNLTDFSILLFHWQTNHRVADINGDGKVNLTDFSIMMFYFTR